MDGYRYHVKHYAEGSEYGINGGKVSKLWMSKDDTTVANYDRGWDIRPDKAARAARRFFDSFERRRTVGNTYQITEHRYGVASFQSGGAFLFDLADLSLIQTHTWHLGKRGYPATHVHGKTAVLHRLLFPDTADEIDHINGDKLDNRRANLRECSHQQNAFNQQRRRTNTSGFIGVSRASGPDTFEAYIHHHGRKYHLGVFPSATAAARTRDCVAKLLFGEYARLNFPRSGGHRHGEK